MSFSELFSKVRYYDKPEGTAPLEKLLGFSKYGFATGAVIGLHDVIMVSHTKTILDTMRCFGFWIVPLTGMTAAFASATYISTNLRKKDDPVNYIVGALASGGVLHAWQKCGLTTFYCTVLFCFIAAIKKDCVQKGWSLAGDPPVCEHVFPVWSSAKAREKKYERGWTM